MAVEFVLMLAELNACLSVAPGSTYGLESGWECDFYFGCGRGIICFFLFHWCHSLLSLFVL